MKALREPDLWWQIKTGEWILENGKVPTEDVFSFTHKGTSWINIKWGFEVVAALIAKIFAPDVVFILQALASVLMLWMLWKTALLFIDGKKFNPLIVAAILFPLLLAGIEYRMNGRPEMTSHLLTAAFLFLLLKNRFHPSRHVFWIVPLQGVWANFHEAFAIGMVLVAIFFFAALLEWKILKLKDVGVQQVQQLGILLVLSVAVVFVNPYGYKMLLQPLKIFGQVFENKFTTELFSITTSEYWQKEAWLAVGSLLAVGGGLILLFVKGKKNVVQFFSKFPLGYLLTIVAFSYLATSAFRNIIFVQIVLFPLLFFMLFYLLESIKKNTAFLNVFALLIPLFIYVLVVSNKYYEWTKSRDRFGLEVRPDFNPVGAADFILNEQLNGKCFSDYLISSYLLWKIPGFETFIDLRDLDVFPASFFNAFTEGVIFPEKFKALNEQYHFDYVVLYRPQFSGLHQFLAQGNGFALAFADAVAAVYVRKEIAFSAVLFHPIPLSSPSAAAGFINQILNPFHQPSSVTFAENKIAEITYFMSIRMLDAAEQAAEAILKTEDAYKGNELLGQIYYNRSGAAAADSAMLLLQTAGNFFAQSLQQKEDYFPALMGLGSVYFQQKFLAQAKELFQRATQAKPSDAGAWLSLAACYKATMQQPESLDEAIHCYEKADRLNKGNPIIQFDLGLLYYQKGDCKRSVERLKRVRGFQGLSAQEQQTLESCLKQCGG